MAGQAGLVGPGGLAGGRRTAAAWAVTAWVTTSAAFTAGTASAQPAAALPALVRSSCADCHSFQAGGPNGQGPNLHGLIGREAGKARGFAYSAGFRKALAGKVWTRELLDAWLTDTQQVAPDTLMTYFMDDAALRAEIVDFMVGTAAK